MAAGWLERPEGVQGGGGGGGGGGRGGQEETDTHVQEDTHVYVHRNAEVVEAYMYMYIQALSNNLHSLSGYYMYIAPPMSMHLQ